MTVAVYLTVPSADEASRASREVGPLSVAVYPRLGQVLREKNLSVTDLARQIEERFGQPVDITMLGQLASAAPVARTDLQLAGAAAAVLGIKLGDLFAVEVSQAGQGGPGESDDVSESAQTRRMAELLDEKLRRSLTTAEWQELRHLVDESGQRIHDRLVAEIAHQRGVSVDQARLEVESEIGQALAWWRRVERDPERRRALVDRALVSSTSITSSR